MISWMGGMRIKRVKDSFYVFSLSYLINGFSDKNKEYRSYGLGE